VFAESVTCGLERVDLAIHLNHETSVMAVEVHYEAVDDLLPTKVETRNLLAAQCLPKNPLSRRHLPTKLLRELQFDRLYPLA
jgi:hypothetical protein